MQQRSSNGSSQLSALNRSGLSRRQALLLGGGALAGLSLPNVAFADGCDAMARLTLLLEDARGGTPVWATTFAPGAVASAKEKVELARIELMKADVNTDKARQLQLLEYVNAVGGTLIVVVGLAASASAAPMVLAGSILFGSGMIVARGLVAPESIDGVEVATNVTVDRIGAVADTYNGSAYVTSQSLKSFLTWGGALTTTATLASTWIAFAQATGEFQRNTMQRSLLEQSLKEAKAALDRLEQLQEIKRLRIACLDAVQTDLKAIQTSTCPALPLP